MTEQVLRTTSTNGHKVTLGQLPRVRGDSSQLGQVLQNLILNGLKYRKKGTEASVRIEEVPGEEGSHTIAVSDNGIGIEAQFIDQIFTIFKRLHSQDEYPGTGLGLAIVKRIVERHGGRVWVHPEFPTGNPEGSRCCPFTLGEGGSSPPRADVEVAGKVGFEPTTHLLVG